MHGTFTFRSRFLYAILDSSLLSQAVLQLEEHSVSCLPSFPLHPPLSAGTWAPSEARAPGFSIPLLSMARFSWLFLWSCDMGKLISRVWNWSAHEWNVYQCCPARKVTVGGGRPEGPLGCCDPGFQSISLPSPSLGWRLDWRLIQNTLCSTVWVEPLLHNQPQMCSYDTEFVVPHHCHTHTCAGMHTFSSFSTLSPQPSWQAQIGFFLS